MEYVGWVPSAGERPYLPRFVLCALLRVYYAFFFLCAMANVS